MIEKRRLPSRPGGVTFIAFEGETAGNMVRVGNARVIRFMTGHAARSRTREFTTRVTAFAVNRRVRQHKGEPECIVVPDDGRGPGHGIVAGLTVRAHVVRQVVRVYGGLILRRVTTDALRGQACEFVFLLVLMTALAIGGGVSAQEGKTRQRMLKAERAPTAARMAFLALVTQLPFVDVIMACVAFAGGSFERQVGVTGCALASRVLALQKKGRFRVVIEGRITQDARPGSGTVTSIACDRDPSMGVSGLGRRAQRVLADGSADTGRDQNYPECGKNRFQPYFVFA
jgi:hypothetical protein